jgi:Condensin II complex subunit CAP-H2 or CNDH2, N-terminal
MASTSAAPSKGDELIKESIELINKMKQQSAHRNGMSVHDRNVTQEQIVQLFIETNDKIDKCIDFDIHTWLTKYENFKEEPNFHQAALLIINAAQIYGRKVDYLEEIVLHMDSDRRKQMEKDG